jgi:hypothetical protein
MEQRLNKQPLALGGFVFCAVPRFLVEIFPVCRLPITRDLALCGPEVELPGADHVILSAGAFPSRPFPSKRLLPL